MPTVGHVKTDAGQSLIEIAVAMPLLLLILIGMVDVGRVYFYSIALEAAAHQGAALAAAEASPDPSAVSRRVCEATGLAPLGAPCTGLAVTVTAPGGGADATVDTTYDVPLLYARILGGLLGSGVVHLRVHATYPGIAP